MSYEGGYYFIDQQIIRTFINQHTKALEDPVSEDTLHAVNLVQDTPWRINQDVLDVMLACFESGMDVGDLPYHDNLSLPSKPSEEWEAMSDEERSDWKKELSRIHTHNARLQGRRQSFATKIAVAKSMRDREAIWFPHFLDFRHRFYPMTADLHPQADDLGKSLLEFAEGKPLGEHGLFWLMVRAANTYGEDKMSLQDRAAWTEWALPAILDSALNPLDGDRFWEDADEPWQFLATCFELERATYLDDPSQFVSFLPINMDGSCNGLQHLSAMGRDRTGAVATNVAANDERQDIYTEVAEAVADIVSREAANGDDHAHKWVGRIDRKVVKRAVMTTPYGVTARGISDQLINDGHTKGMTGQGGAAVFLRNQILEALDQTVVSAKQIMGWIQECAAELGRNGLPLVWTTPAGNKVAQGYYELNMKRITTLYGKLGVYEENRDGGIEVRKQTLASAPNVIHSYDAAHLTLTVIEMAKRIPDVSFSMVHDSFGTHACDVHVMNETLRDTFAQIYSANQMEHLYQEWADLMSREGIDVTIPHWSEHVELGDFDPRECLQSEFFFS